jgi:hypothetical protein
MPVYTDDGTLDPIYQRQADIGLAYPGNVYLVGCGGVGCWIALALVLAGLDYLTLFDGDTVSIHNLNRFPLPESAVGQPKSLALAKWLKSLRPTSTIQARGEFSPIYGYDRPSWVVCATDNLKSRQMCHKWAKEQRANYLEVGADGERWTLSPTPPEFSTDNENMRGYTSVPVHVGPCMMAGAAAAYYVLHNAEPGYSHTGMWTGSNRLELRDVCESTTYLCKVCKESHTSIFELIQHIRGLHYSWFSVQQAKMLAERWEFLGSKEWNGLLPYIDGDGDWAWNSDGEESEESDSAEEEAIELEVDAEREREWREAANPPNRPEPGGEFNVDDVPAPIREEDDNG